MRLHMILLLLLNILAVADAALKCDQSLIKEVNGAKISFNKKKILTCVNGDNTVLAIKFGSKLYTHLFCDEKEGWTNPNFRNTPNTKIAEADQQLDIACVEYCATSETGHIFNVISRDYRKTFCASKFGLFHDGQFLTNAIITCDLEEGWTLDENYRRKSSITNDTTTPFQVECKPACSLVTMGAGVRKFSDSYREMYDCNSAGYTEDKYRLKVNGHLVYSYVQCSPERGIGFHDENSMNILVDTYDNVKLECGMAPQLCEFHASAASGKTNYEGATKTLTCVRGGNSLSAIRFESKRYDSLICDETSGWKSEDEKVAEAYQKITVTCEDYCASTGGILTVGGDSVSVHCKNEPYHGLFLNGERVKGDRAECNSNGWSLGEKKLSDTVTPLKFECTKADPPPCHRLWIAGVNDAEITFTEENKQLTCNGHDTLVAIQLGSKLYSTISCHETEGWKKVERNGSSIPNEPKIAEADQLLNIKCVEYCTYIRAEGMYSTVNSLQLERRINCMGKKRLIHDGQLVEGRSGDTTCNLKNGWTFSGQQIEHDIMTQFQVECMPGCYNVELMNGVKDSLESGIREFECNTDEKSILRLNGIYIYSKIRCQIDYDLGYKDDNGDLFARPFDHVKLECVPAPPCYVQVCIKLGQTYCYDDAKGTHFDQTTNTLTCDGEGNALNAIAYHDREINFEKHFESLTCDEAGNKWTGVEMDDILSDSVAPATTPLTIKCTKYCEVTGKGLRINVNKYNNSKEVSVSCEDDTHELVYKDEIDMKDIIIREAKCQLHNRWKFTTVSNNGKMKLRLVEFAKFECRIAPLTTTTPKIEPTPNTSAVNTDTPKLSTTKSPGKNITSTPPVNTDGEKKGNGQGGPSESGAQTTAIIAGCSIGGLLFIIIIAIVIFKVVSGKRRRQAKAKSELSKKINKSEKTNTNKTKSEMSGNTKTNKTKSEMSGNTKSDKSGKSKSEKTKSEMSGKSEKTKNNKSGKATKSEKTKSQMSVKAKKGGSKKESKSGRDSKVKSEKGTKSGRDSKVKSETDVSSSRRTK